MGEIPVGESRQKEYFQAVQAWQNKTGHILMIRQWRSDNVRKPTYYIWLNNCSTREEYEMIKKRYTKMGFRVVTFQDGRNNYDIQEGIRAVIKNHLIDFYD